MSVRVREFTSHLEDMSKLLMHVGGGADVIFGALHVTLNRPQGSGGRRFGFSTKIVHGFDR